MEVGSNADADMVLYRVIRHCCQHTDPATPFSSWSHDYRTALRFACTRLRPSTGGRERLKEDHDSYVAVLDTWALGDEKTLLNKIFHVPQFGIARINYPCEWLIWGPVSGPAYRCVSVSTIRETIGCQKWPAHVPLKKEEPYLVLKDVRDSLLVAGCFQRKDDTSADVMLAVAACELACRLWGAPKNVCGHGDLETDAERIWPREVLEDLLGVLALCNPVLSGRPLVHGRSALVGFPRVRLMYTLLSKAEACWGYSDSDAPWAPVDWKQIFLRENFEWRDSSCVLCVKREEDSGS
ncbi:hypothetical protein LA080_014493 [Diaporthe eres]|nr:hypothetical protein LA080_014493 [Diaporthe eres]